MQTATIILFTALILGLFCLFLLPGRSGPPDHRPDAPPYRDDDLPPPGSTMSRN